MCACARVCVWTCLRAYKTVSIVGVKNFLALDNGYITDPDAHSSTDRINIQYISLGIVPLFLNVISHAYSSLRSSGLGHLGVR